MRQTKIIATLGPASSSDEVMTKLVEAGVNIFRLNFSHGTHEAHRKRYERVRDIARAAGRTVAILQDLSGPKIRTGKLKDGQPLRIEAGERLTIGIGDFVGEPGRVSTTYAPLATALKKGDRLLLDDGKLELEVEHTSGEAIETVVVDGGELGENKGINAPSVPLPAVGITDKDAVDLRFGLDLGVDMVALSFVQSAEDVWRARQLSERAGRGDVPLIAKLERPEAIERLEEVLAAADAVMVARGDLGLELPLEQVPRMQREILRHARERGVPAIVATQVLESMRTEPRPTRAEVSDAAGAVDAGADAIMLSGETAIGQYPIRSVQVLDSIIRAAEAVPPPMAYGPARHAPDHVPALCDAAVTLADQGGVDALVAVTRTGRTARLLSARRPDATIYAVTDSEELARRLTLWWGVVPHVLSLDGTVDEVSARVLEQVHRERLPPAAKVVVVNTSPDLDASASNFITLRQLG